MIPSNLHHERVRHSQVSSSNQNFTLYKKKPKYNHLGTLGFDDDYLSSNM